MQIRRIVPRPLAILSGVMYAIFGFVAGLFMLTLSLIDTSSPGEARLMSMLAPIVFSLGYGLMGLIMGYIGAWLYNAVAKRVGGIELETE
jgi:hypothetical protein